MVLTRPLTPHHIVSLCSTNEAWSGGHLYPHQLLEVTFPQKCVWASAARYRGERKWHWHLRKRLFLQRTFFAPSLSVFTHQMCEPFELAYSSKTTLLGREIYSSLLYKLNPCKSYTESCKSFQEKWFSLVTLLVKQSGSRQFYRREINPCLVKYAINIVRFEYKQAICYVWQW